MVGLDEGALICDFAEVYHVFDWRALPVRLAATLAMGLGPKSRIMRKMSGCETDIDTLLLATISDALRVLVWQNTEDGSRGRNRPTLISELLSGSEEKTVGFDTPAEFDAWRAGILGGEKNA